MSLKALSYNEIIGIADLWQGIGGGKKIEIGALEPLLWRDRQYRIHDVVSVLTNFGFEVSITTNGQLLYIFVDKLSSAGLSLLRTSWHTTDPSIFRKISGGYGDYERFMSGIKRALESGIKVVFNRILLKGYTDDIPTQLTFIQRYKSKLKLYTLLWTPQNSSIYKKFYQDWHPIVRTWVLPHTIKILRVKSRIGRTRLRFYLTKGGIVEVKLGERVDRTCYPCSSCSFKNICEEGFGEYVRIDPRLNMYFCYLRHDLGIQISEYFGRINALKQKMQELFGDVDHIIKSASLRLTVTPFCNFNCKPPESDISLCLEKPGKYIFPKLRC